MHKWAGFTCASTLLLIPPMALAHVGVAVGSGFHSGLAHPFSGLDHLLVMLAVGVMAARVGGQAQWLIPSSFVFFVAIGGVLGQRAVGLPHVELAIAASVAALGMLIAARRHLPTAALMALAGAFALFHGHAHGTEMPVASSPVFYAAEFTLSTALLHLAGVGIGTAMLRIGGGAGWIRQLSGATMAVVGAGMVAQAI